MAPQPIFEVVSAAAFDPCDNVTGHHAPKGLQAADYRVSSFGWTPDRAEDDEGKAFAWGGDLAVAQRDLERRAGSRLPASGEEELATRLAIPTAANQPCIAND